MPTTLKKKRVKRRTAPRTNVELRSEEAKKGKRRSVTDTDTQTVTKKENSDKGKRATGIS